MTVPEYNKSVDDFSDGLYRFVLKNTGDGDRARDIVQDTYEKLWVRISFVNAAKVKSYLFTTAYHTLIDVLRKEKRLASLEDQKMDVQADPDHYTGLKEVLDEAISHLSPDQRSVIMLRDYEGYSYEEIAEITGLSESQVKVYIFRGRMFLKRYLGKIEAIL